VFEGSKDPSFEKALRITSPEPGIVKLAFDAAGGVKVS
jgi:hypothetical protein